MSSEKPIRVYADTSVFGGCFDVEFEAASVRFFEEVRLGRIRLVISDTTALELTEAPEHVRRVLADLPPSSGFFSMKRSNVCEMLI